MIGQGDGKTANPHFLKSKSSAEPGLLEPAFEGTKTAAPRSGGIVRLEKTQSSNSASSPSWRDAENIYYTLLKTPTTPTSNASGSTRFSLFVVAREGRKE